MRTLSITSFALAALIGSAAIAEGPEQPVSAPFRMPLHAYPNPCTEHVTFIMPGGLRGNTRADVRDGAGRPLLSWPLGIPGLAGTSITLDTPELPPGVYVLSLIDEMGDEASTTLVKV